MLQMMIQNKIQQIPQGMITQMEQQLKRTNPQAFQKYQQARKDNNKMIARLYDEVEKKYKEYSRPQIVQLELFG